MILHLSEKCKIVFLRKVKPVFFRKLENAKTRAVVKTFERGLSDHLEKITGRLGAFKYTHSFATSLRVLRHHAPSAGPRVQPLLGD